MLESDFVPYYQELRLFPSISKKCRMEKTGIGKSEIKERGRERGSPRQETDERLGKKEG